MSLYNDWKAEISRRAGSGAPGRRVMDESPRLRALAADYRPVPRNSMPGRLETIRRSILEPVELAMEAGARPAASREELTQGLEAVEAELAAVPYFAPPEQVEVLLRRREALRFLLEKVPSPVEVPDAISLNAAVREAVEAETGRLRAWVELLKRESDVIKTEVEEFERQGGGDYQARRLYQDLADTLQLLIEGEDNLKLAKRPPLPTSFESVKRAAVERPPVDKSIRDAPTVVSTHWSLR